MILPRSLVIGPYSFKLIIIAAEADSFTINIYLNIPFFTIRFVAFFAIWIFLTQRIKKLSLDEDRIGGLTNFNKIEFLSKLFIFVFAITFSLFSIDW